MVRTSNELKTDTTILTKERDKIDSYPPLECPHCESEEIYQTWKARAYD